MHIHIIPNRNSKPAVLLRESYRVLLGIVNRVIYSVFKKKCAERAYSRVCQTRADRQTHELHDIANTELLHDRGSMIAGRPDTDSETLGNLVTGGAMRNQFEHLQLLLGKTYRLSGHGEDGRRMKSLGRDVELAVSDSRYHLGEQARRLPERDEPMHVRPRALELFAGTPAR